MCLLTSAAAARADGGDVIYLKNGGMVRGTLIDATPERPARIQLVTGEVSTIAWSDVDHVVTAAAAAAPPAPPAAAGPTVRLHVESPRELEIVGRANDGADWAPMCGGACDKAVPAGWEYQARGDGVKPSAPFVLKAGASGAASVHVDPASKGAFILGMIGVVGGGSVGLLGLMLTAIGASGHVTQTVNGVTTTQPVDPGVLPAGIVIMVVGVAALVTGGVVALNNWSTGVTQGSAGVALAPLQTQHFQDAAREAPRMPGVATSTLVNLQF